MGFVGILKGFDSVPRKQVWEHLRKRGIETKLRKNIKTICEVTRNYVRKDGEQPEEFATKEGLRRGALSSILLIMNIAKEIKSKIEQIHVGYKCLEAMSIGECVFADDLVVFAKNRSELKYNLVL